MSQEMFKQEMLYGLPTNKIEQWAKSLSVEGPNGEIEVLNVKRRTEEGCQGLTKEDYLVLDEIVRIEEDNGHLVNQDILLTKDAFLTRGRYAYDEFFGIGWLS